MLDSSMAGTLAVWRMTLLFAAGALVVWALAALLRAGLTALLEPRGHRLDRWRRVWFEPERELGLLLEALLVIAFVATFARRYDWPAWAGVAVAGLWALHAPVDLWNWLRWRGRPRSTRGLHERGFLLLDLGPLWLRAAVAALAAALELLFLGPAFLDRLMTFLLAGLEQWLA